MQHARLLGTHASLRAILGPWHLWVPTCCSSGLPHPLRHLSLHTCPHRCCPPCSSPQRLEVEVWPVESSLESSQ